VGLYLSHLNEDYAKEEVLEGVFKRVHHQIKFSGIDNIERVKDGIFLMGVLME
jgi:hypothetical protein